LLPKRYHARRVAKARRAIRAIATQQPSPARQVEVKALDDIFTTTTALDPTARMYAKNWATSKTQLIKGMVDWVWAAISAIADKTAEAEWSLYYDRKDKPPVRPEHRAWQLFRRPNDHQAWYDVAWITTAHNRLCGEAYWWMESKAPPTIRLLRPDGVSEQNGRLMYSEGGKQLQLPLEEVGKFMAPSALAPDGNAGYSPLRAIAGIVQSYLGMRVAEFSSFRQSIINQVMLLLEESVSPEGAKEIQAQLQRHIGANAAGRNLAMIGVKGIERVGLSPKEIVSPDTARNFRREIEHDLKNYILTVNEVRESRGLDAVAWGDSPLAPFGIGPVHTESLVTPPTSGERAVARDAALSFVQVKTNARRFEAAFRRMQERWEDRFTAEIVKQVFGPLAEYWISLVTGPPKQVRWDPKHAAEIMTALYKEIAVEGAGRHYAEAIAGAFNLDFNLSHWRQAYAEFYQERGVEFWTDRVTSSRRVADAAIADATSGVTSVRDAIARIENEFGRVRATRIARTEITGAMNGGALKVYEVNAVNRKEWIATVDELTRESHMMADGQVVATTDPFTVGGSSLSHPGDPSGEPGEIINCRCSVAPVV